MRRCTALAQLRAGLKQLWQLERASVASQSGAAGQPTAIHGAWPQPSAVPLPASPSSSTWRLGARRALLMAPFSARGLSNRSGGSNTGTTDSTSVQHAPGGPGMLGRIEPRMAMVFTCGVCSRRAVKTFSRQSYQRGVVLVRCPGCQKLHLIADHLGWFGDKGWTVQDLAAEGGVHVKDLTSPTEAAESAAQLTAEDWLGWSRVQELLKAAGTGHGGNGSSQGSTQEKAASGQNSESLPQPPPAPQPSEPDGVLELGPQDLARWRRVSAAHMAGRQGK